MKLISIEEAEQTLSDQCKAGTIWKHNTTNDLYLMASINHGTGKLRLISLKDGIRWSADNDPFSGKRSDFSKVEKGTPLTFEV